MPDKSKFPDNEKSKLDTMKIVSRKRKVDDAPRGVKTQREFDPSTWVPKTELGKKVKAGEIKSIEEIFQENKKIMESEIIDMLIPNLGQELLFVGQSKGKFGGGKRSIWRQTQKKTKEGNKPKFSTVIVVGNKDGFFGIGRGKAKETMPAREKALRKAKLNLMSIRRGCGAWACGCKEHHTIPFKVSGKCGSVKIELIPAPKGSGLKIEKECYKVLELAGIKDVYSKTFGHTNTKINLLSACFEALQKLSKIKISETKIKEVLEGCTKDGQ
jgi:small subunit ribosomal protein S5